MFIIDSSVFIIQSSMFKCSMSITENSLITISMFTCSLSKFTIHSLTFIHNSVHCSMFSISLSSVHCSSSAFTVQMFKINVQIQSSKFHVQVQSSVFNDGAWISQVRVWCPCVHRSPVSDTYFRVSQCPLSGSLVHEVTPDDDQIPCTNCSLQVLRYSC